jgi:hypothetical protein
MNEFAQPAPEEMRSSAESQDPAILSSITPEDYSKQMQEIQRMMTGSAAERDYSVTARGDLISEIPQFIMEVAGGVDKGMEILEKAKDPEGTLVLLDRNIPNTAQIEVKPSENSEMIIKGFRKRVFIYTDKTHDNLPVAMALTDKFADDLYRYIDAKEKAI